MAALYTLILNDPERGAIRFELDPAPSEVRHDMTGLTTLQRLPFGGTYREGYGLGIEDLTLRGSFGFRSRVVDGETVDGNTLFYRLKEGFFETYQTHRASKDKRLRAVTAEFHHWEQDEHWLCEPMQFVDPRDREARIHHRYEITLKLYKRIEGTPIQEKSDPIRKVLAQIAATINEAQDALATVGEVIRTIRTKAAELIGRVRRDLVGISNAAQEVLAGVRDTLLLPARALNSVLSAVDTAISALGALVTDSLIEAAHTLRGIRRNMTRLLSLPNLFSQDLASATEEMARQYYEIPTGAEREVEREALEAGQNQAKRERASRLVQRNVTGASSVVVRTGDTLQRIALRELGDAARWKEIALLNGLDRWPYLSSDGSAGTIQYGKPVLIPATPQNSTNTSTLSDDRYKQQGDTASRLYGRDLKLYMNDAGKLDIALLGNGDPVLVGGHDNLIQAVMLKTRVFQGELLENKDFGLRRLVGERTAQGAVRLAAFGVRVAAQSDRRIKSATVTARAQANAVWVDVSVQPAGSSGAVGFGGVVGGAG